MDVWHQLLTYHHEALERRSKAILDQDDVKIIYLQGKVDAYKEMLDYMGDRIPGSLQ